MDFDYTDEERELAAILDRYLKTEYSFAERQDICRQGGFSPKHWAQFAAMGIIGADADASIGGLGAGIGSQIIIAEALGRHLVLEPFLAGTVMPLHLMETLPLSSEISALASAIIAGESVTVIAHGEGQANPWSPPTRTNALRAGKRWRISGEKSFVLSGGMADQLIVSASTDRGMGLFLVGKGAPGLRIRNYRLLDHGNAAHIEFDKVVPEYCLFESSDVSASMAHVTQALDHGLVALCADAVGAIDAAIRLTRQYLSMRVQFGSTLDQFQVLQHRMADMLVEYEMSRSILYQGAAQLAQPADARIAGLSAMKAFVSSAAIFVGRQAIQLHGAIGVTEEYSVGHYYKRLFVMAGLLGNEAFHLERLANTGSGFWCDADEAKSAPVFDRPEKEPRAAIKPVQSVNI